MSLVGFSVSNDLFEHKSIDEQRMLRITRWTMLGIGIITLLIAFVAPVEIFWLTYFVGTLFASSWGPVALMSVWSRRITADAAFWGIISGFVFNAGPKAMESMGWIALPIWLDPVLLGGIVSLSVVLVVSRIGQVSRIEQLYRMRLHRTPESEIDPRKLRRTLLAPLIMVVYSLTTTVIYLVAYIGPYRRATGTAATAELVLVLCGPVLVCSTAFVAWRMINKSYR